ncbi:MAG: hypothetical protein IJL32_15260 [Oscillospiraceae bacterium]|nr:hypothetical protein [Oscillospiraceae bacterium]
MKHRKKGRRIYTYRARNRRVFSRNHPMRSAFGTAVLLILLGVCGITGYNIVGPVMERMQLEAETPTTTPDPYFETEHPVQTTEASPAETDVTAPVTTVTASEATTTVTTTTTQPAKYGEGATVAYLVSPDALSNRETLEAAARKISADGYTSMILPLKLKGGMLTFASENPRAKECGACNDGMLKLRQMYNLAKRCGLTCIGQLSTLEDHVYPNVYMEGSYTFQNGATRWLDNKPEQGGKPWLNPFDDASGNYLSELAAEIEKAGFKGVICTDTVFPHFFNSDAELLGNRIQDAVQRKQALSSVLNRISAAASGASCYVTLEGLAAGTEEAFDSEQLLMRPVVVEMDPAAYTQPFSVGEQRYDPAALAEDDRLAMLAAAAKQAIGNHDLIPCISAGGKTAAELDHIICTFIDAGYQTVYVTGETGQAEPAEDGTTESESADSN